MPAPRVLLDAGKSAQALFAPAIADALAAAGVAADLVLDAAPAGQVAYIIKGPGGSVSDYGAFPQLRAVFCLWAGVEELVANPTLRVPLTRMVDEGLRRGMVEWVTAHVLRHHVGTDTHVLGQDGCWRNETLPPLATARSVGVLGLGELGGAVADALAGLGFRVSGWSRSPRAMARVTCRTGTEGLAETLAESEILVLLLPDTAATRDILDAGNLARLPRGAVVINAGRGTLVDETALLAALDAGRLSHATLDVFRTEPLPPAHPFWSHPRVTVTPHVAAATRPETAAPIVAENLRRAEAGEPLRFLVDRAAGY